MSSFGRLVSRSHPCSLTTQILDAHAEEPWHVDAGSTVTTLPARKRLLAGGARQARRLVDLHAHAVTEAVAEVLAVARRLDDRVPHASTSRPLSPARTAAKRRFLGAQHELIDLRCASASTAPVAYVRVQSEQ